MEDQMTDDFEYRDRVYEIDAFCNLDCGFEGECLMERETGGSIKKRCLCPHGKFGEKCSMGKKNTKIIQLSF